MLKADEERVTIEVEILKATEKAVLVEFEGDEVWIPKSQIDEDASEVELEKGASGVLSISQWIAEQKGLV